MKPYAVEVTFTMIVMAEDRDDAYEAAVENSDEAWRDTYDKEHSVIGLALTEEDLKRHGWDGQCIPYGGGGDTRLADILANLEPEPVKDERTSDMFAAEAK